MSRFAKPEALASLRTNTSVGPPQNRDQGRTDIRSQYLDPGLTVAFDDGAGYQAGRHELEDAMNAEPGQESSLAFQRGDVYRDLHQIQPRPRRERLQRPTTISFLPRRDSGPDQPENADGPGALRHDFCSASVSPRSKVQQRQSQETLSHSWNHMESSQVKILSTIRMNLKSSQRMKGKRKRKRKRQLAKEDLFLDAEKVPGWQSEEKLQTSKFHIDQGLCRYRHDVPPNGVQERASAVFICHLGHPPTVTSICFHLLLQMPEEIRWQLWRYWRSHSCSTTTKLNAGANPPFTAWLSAQASSLWAENL